MVLDNEGDKQPIPPWYSCASSSSSARCSAPVPRLRPCGCFTSRTTTLLTALGPSELRSFGDHMFPILTWASPLPFTCSLGWLPARCASPLTSRHCCWFFCSHGGLPLWCLVIAVGSFSDHSGLLRWRHILLPRSSSSTATGAFPLASCSVGVLPSLSGSLLIVDTILLASNVSY